MRARGFTLVELTVVITIIGLMAVVVVPRMTNIRDSARSKETAAKLVAAVETGRALARSRGEQIVVGLDPSNGQVSLAGTNESADDRFESTLTIPGRFTVTSVDRTDAKGQMKSADVQAKSGETLGIFYEDGTAEPATAELTVGDQKRTLRVSADGSVMFGADLPASEEKEKWQAGDLESRA